MTLSELDDSLPNGIHDAYLERLSVSFAEGSVTLGLKLLVSSVGEKARYQDAEIKASGLLVLVIQGPDGAPTSISEPLGICSFQTSEQYYPGFSNCAKEIQPMFHSFYVEEPWNSYIHIAAERAEISWQ